MSDDMVDDLHYAEDVVAIGRAALETAARDLHLFHSRGSFGDCQKEACVRLRTTIEILASYCRASCYLDDGTWACDPDCGCPGDHPSSHDERED